MSGCIRVGAIVVWLFVVSQASGAPPDGAHRVLDKPAFTASAAELLALGRAAPAGDWPVVVLREDSEISFDGRGGAVLRVRHVYVVQTEIGVDTWGNIDAYWVPSHQDRPLVRARVIEPTGNVVELDSSMITEGPVPRQAANAAGERRVLTARLPGMQIGAIVEQELVHIEREPVPSAGSVHTTRLGGDVPTSSTVISYSAPAASKVHQAERKLPAGVRVRHHIANGRRSWVYRLGALPVQASHEFFTPGDVVRQPYVGVSTGASWAAVARAYGAVVDRRIAEGPFSLPPELPRTATIETVAAITAWLHRQVRYTGIKLDRTARIPSLPSETVKRGTGDGKDKATLLVALLRQAGIRAALALLVTGPDIDLDPDLPGMSSFDHVIVRAQLGGREVWIDATEEQMRSGQLPWRAQGRRVLVIADGTRGLSTTPISAPADNVIREVRTFVVPEEGPAQLTEVTQLRGEFEAQRRTWATSSRIADLDKNAYTEHAKTEYGGTLESVSSSDAGDLATPFEITVVVNGVRRVFADRERIDVHLYPGAALRKIPWLATDDEEMPRTRDFAWPIPHIFEVENRIVLPPGFTLPSAAPERIRALGTAKLIERRQVDGRTLIVTFRFESGRPRLTPAEFTAVRAAVREVAEEGIHLKIEQTALALSHAGKHRDAIAECERLIALHPKEGIHHGQLAQVLISVGAGASARREAHKGVALAPGKADPLVILGWALSFDTLGRQYTYDWDRAGAIAALQKALKIDPTHVGGAIALAHLLQRDSFGRMFESGADLPGAVAAWRAVLALEKSDQHVLALAAVLLWWGQFAEAERVARTATQNADRDRWIIAAVAGSSGATAALATAGDLLTGASRTKAIDAAAALMLQLQRYDVARALYAETGSLARMPSIQAALISKITKQPAVTPGSTDPRAAARELLITLVDPRYKTPLFWDPVFERGFRERFGQLPPALRSARVRFLVDLAQALSTVEVEGDAGAWRAILDNQGQGQLYRAYLVLDRGIVKLIGTSDMLSSVGRYLLGTTDAKGEARARRLLDWIRSDLDKETAAIALTFRKLWGPGMPSTRDAILLVAAVLAGNSDPDRAIPIGVRCASTLPDAALACHELLLGVYSQCARWADALSELDAIVALRPAAAEERAVSYARVLRELGRFDDADHFLDGVLAKSPDHRGAQTARFEVAARRGAVAEALQRADAILRLPNVSDSQRATDFNNLAWYRLAVGRDLPIALELARKAVEKAPDRTNVVNTLAAIEAELGELDRAVRDNRKAMELHALEPQGSDWYVMGRIYEQLGLRDDAIAAYKRVTTGGWQSSYELAQKRLAAMSAP